LKSKPGMVVEIEKGEKVSKCPRCGSEKIVRWERPRRVVYGIGIYHVEFMKCTECGCHFQVHKLIDY